MVIEDIGIIHIMENPIVLMLMVPLLIDRTLDPIGFQGIGKVMDAIVIGLMVVGSKD